jgi:UDPglucose--hexose-1-phosphate uridylyltransferase
VSDIRFDPVFNHWVAIARNRHDRPMEFSQLDSLQPQLLCPFCLGNEEETPEAVATYDAQGANGGQLEDSPRWIVRVIPNKYPIFPARRPPEAKEPKQVSRHISNQNPYQTCDARGEQEVVVCSPRHVTSLSELTDDEVLVSFQAFQDRIAHLQTLAGIEHGMLFLNCRASAGATLSHIHAQLIGSPLISDGLQRRVDRFRDFYQTHHRSLLEACAGWEVQQKVRMIYQSEHFYVFCPYAARTPFQVWLVPKHSQENFAAAPTEMREELARSCRWLVNRLEQLVDHPGYNLLLHQAPFSLAAEDHWFFELAPRLTRQAGYEWGTQIWVNPVSPETSAKRLKLK